MATPIEQMIDRVTVKLQRSPREEEIENGWSIESKRIAAQYFENLERAIRFDEPLPDLGIVRGLDHWGVTGGELLEEIAMVVNRLREEQCPK